MVAPILQAVQLSGKVAQDRLVQIVWISVEGLQFLLVALVVRQVVPVPSWLVRIFAQAVRVDERPEALVGLQRLSGLAVQADEPPQSFAVRAVEPLEMLAVQAVEPPVDFGVQVCLQAVEPPVVFGVQVAVQAVEPLGMFAVHFAVQAVEPTVVFGVQVAVQAVERPQPFAVSAVEPPEPFAVPAVQQPQPFAVPAVEPPQPSAVPVAEQVVEQLLAGVANEAVVAGELTGAGRLDRPGDWPLAAPAPSG